jgi:hypothetical protein
MQLLLLLIALFAGLFWFMRWSSQAGPTRTTQILRWIAMGGVGLLLLMAFTRGGAALVAPFLALLLPIALRHWRKLLPIFTNGMGKRVGNGNSASTVHTQFLHMSLDHSSGDMQGQVVMGQFQGRHLTDLTLQELLTLWQECQQDAQSAAVLETYLDRTHDNWREAPFQEDDSPGAAQPKSSTQEAYEILGLQPGASKADIKAAHRRLIQRLHPDHGGSSYLAARINWAKDVLLRGGRS